jgi:endonuclease/exonuclease/phosphatase (EEP) superfamily protein YafD
LQLAADRPLSGVPRGLIARAAVSAGWILGAGMAGLGMNRIFRSTRWPHLIGLQAVGMWLLLPAYPLTLLALIGRRWALAGVAATLSAANTVWLRRQTATGRAGVAPAGASRIRLVTANIFGGNGEVPLLAGDLAAGGADLILLQEVTEQHVADLRAAGVLDAFPFQVLAPSGKPHGSAILSKLPIKCGAVIAVAGYPMTRAEVETASGSVVVVNVHPLAPSVGHQVAAWREQLAGLTRLVGDEAGPLIVAGDFNATADHLPFNQLLGTGLRDAFDEAGKGIGATWPAWRRPMIPVMRLDHVLVRGPMTVLSAEVQDIRGSDHRRVSVEVAVG